MELELDSKMLDNLKKQIKENKDKYRDSGSQFFSGARHGGGGYLYRRQNTDPRYLLLEKLEKAIKPKMTLDEIKAVMMTIENVKFERFGETQTVAQLLKEEGHSVLNDNTVKIDYEQKKPFERAFFSRMFGVHMDETLMNIHQALHKDFFNSYQLKPGPKGYIEDEGATKFLNEIEPYGKHKDQAVVDIKRDVLFNGEKSGMGNESTTNEARGFVNDFVGGSKNPDVIKKVDFIMAAGQVLFKFPASEIKKKINAEIGSGTHRMNWREENGAIYCDVAYEARTFTKGGGALVGFLEKGSDSLKWVSISSEEGDRVMSLKRGKQASLPPIASAKYTFRLDIVGKGEDAKAVAHMTYFEIVSHTQDYMPGQEKTQDVDHAATHETSFGK